MLVPHGRYHEVDIGNPKGKNIPGDPSLRVFGRSVAWSLQLSFPWGSMHLEALSSTTAWVFQPHFQNLSSALPSCMSYAQNLSYDLLIFKLCCVQARACSPLAVKMERML